MDKRLLDILCCPVTKSPLRPLAASELALLNREVAAGHVLNGSGQLIAQAVEAGLITRDGRTIYRIDDDIPVMLASDAIATSQLAEFSPS